MKTPTTIAACLFAAVFAHGQNLILNGDFEAGNSNFSNDYVYSPNNMFPARTYCVVTNPASVHSSWSSFGDHTTGNGLMLVANGDTNPTNVVWRQSVSAAINTDYLFSAWGASSFSGNPARFFFIVNGVQQGNTVDLPRATGIWQNYSVIWSSGGSVAALLEIRMVSTEFGGNDFVLDDLSFRAITATVPSPALLHTESRRGQLAIRRVPTLPSSMGRRGKHEPMVQPRPAGDRQRNHEFSLRPARYQLKAVLQSDPRQLTHTVWASPR